jgi:hypothetical protein
MATPPCPPETIADQIERLNNLTPAAGERHEEGVMAAIDR